MLLKKNNIIECAIVIFILLLAFTDLHVFKTERLKFSFYIVYGALFIILISALKFKIPPLKFSFPILILLYIIFSSLINYSNVKVTSIIYSLLFITYFLYLSYYSKQYLSNKYFVWTLKCILISFFGILILSQLLVFFNLQELKGPEGFFQSTGQFGIEFNNITKRYRYYSLSSEPSYAAVIVLVTYVSLNNQTINKKFIFIYSLITLYMLLSFNSSIGYLGLLFWFLSQFNLTKKQFLFFLIIIFIGIICFFFTNLGGKSVDRLRGLIFLFFTNNGNFLENLDLIDSSAHARIGPFFTYVQEIDFFSIHTYFGHGTSASDSYFSKIIYPEVWNKKMVFNAPFIPGFLYDYGIFGVSLVLYFIWKLIRKESVFFKFILLIILFNSNFNTQLFWFCIIIVSLNFFYINQIADKKIAYS